jgi:hypothetical protein
MLVWSSLTQHMDCYISHLTMCRDADTQKHILDVVQLWSANHYNNEEKVRYVSYARLLDLMQ